MYTPKHFKSDDPAIALSVMQQNPFALLVTQIDGELDGTHVPVVTTRANDQFVLRFHLARANPSAAALTANAPLLLVFTGPNCYISPDWYGDHRPNAVPTWNYAVVHAKGTAETVDDADLVEILTDLGAENEARLAPKPPWTDKKMEPAAFKAMRRAIVGFNLTVKEVQTKLKVGQNRDARQRAGVRSALKSSSDRDAIEIANLIPES